MFSRTILRSSVQLPKQLQSISNYSRPFHSTPAIMVKVGDSIPNVELTENSLGNKVDLADELASGNGIIIGVPAAFSPGCSDTHLPGYLASHKIHDAGKVFVVSVNDVFVMKAWGKYMDEEKKSGIRFLSDASGEFTKALDLVFDSEAYFGNKRSKRYALKTSDGKITKVGVEPDPTKVTVSGADENL